MIKRVLLAIFLLFASHLIFAQMSFDVRYNQATSFVGSKDYDKAIKILEAAKKMPGLTQEQELKADKLLVRCKSLKQKSKAFTISKKELAIPPEGGLDSLDVFSSLPWAIVNQPVWCDTYRKGNKLFVFVSENEAPKKREGKIILQNAGASKKTIVSIIQESVLLKPQDIIIKTSPGGASLLMNDAALSSDEEITIPSGEHRFVIRKDGYEPVDTTLTIYNNGGDLLELRFKLKPKYAKAVLNIYSEDDLPLQSVPKVMIDSTVIDLNASDSLSFDSSHPITYLSMYNDGVIPISPGEYVINVSADGYFERQKHVLLFPADSIVIDFPLKPKKGFLTLRPSADENGIASVYIDGTPYGQLQDSIRVSLAEGNHIISAVQDGFTMTSDSNVYMQAGHDSTYSLVMEKTYTCFITSTPVAFVYVDGELKGETPIRLSLSGSVHKVDIEKEGYLTSSFDTSIINEHPSVDGEKRVVVNLAKKYPYTISSDEEGQRIKLTGKLDKKIYVDSLKTPAVIDLPLGQSYRVELFNHKNKRVFMGSFTFNNENRNVFKANTLNRMVLVEGSFNVRNADSFGLVIDGKQYYMPIDINLAKIKLLPGLSTSCLSAELLFEKKHSELYNTYFRQYVYNVIPFLSPCFTNYDFRIGGAITRGIDVDLLGCVAAYLPITRLLNSQNSRLYHPSSSGVNCFVGVELTSGLPIANLSLRAGYRFGELSVNITNVINNYSTTYTSDERWKMSLNTFEISLGISLGTMKSCGQNILRVF